MQMLRTNNFRGGGLVPSLNLDFMQGVMPPGLSFSRASSGTYYDANGVLQTAAINVPRFDYDPATLQLRGLLIEEQRTNLLIKSGEFDDNTWVKSNSSVTANVALAPNGVLAADAIAYAGGSVFQYVQQDFPITAGTTYCMSLFAKGSRIAIRADSRSGNLGGGVNTGPEFNLTAGTITTSGGSGYINATIVPAGGGWYRVSVCKTATASGTGTVAIDNAGNSQGSAMTTYVWGAQVEAGNFPTSYIPTASAAVTRSADVCTLFGVAGWFNAVQGTLFAEVLPISLYGDSGSLTDDGISNRIQFGGSQQFYVSPGPGIVGLVNFTPMTRYKMAGAYQSGNYAFASNGQVLATSNNTTVPSGINRLRIGSYNSSNSFLNGWQRKFLYYPRRLPNSTLQALTQ